MNRLKDNLYHFKLGSIYEQSYLENLVPLGLSPTENQFFRLDNANFKYTTQNGRTARLHSRKTQGLIECLIDLDAKEYLKQFDKTRIGVYVNTFHDHLNDEYPVFKFLEKEPELYKMLRNYLPPTFVIKHNCGIIPGHLCIYLESHGPSFLVSSMGVKNIFEIAKLDLASNKIDCAVVGIVNSYEDPLSFFWHKSLSENLTPTEAVAVFLITSPSFDYNLNFQEMFSKQQYYGYLNEFRG